MEKTLEKNETHESWMSRCRAVYKRNRQRKMQLGNRAKMQAREEIRSSGKKGGSKGQEKRWQGRKQNMFALVVTQTHCSVRGVEREATQICTPLVKMTVEALKKHLTVMRSFKRGVFHF